MKAKVVFLLCMILSVMAFGQNEKSNYLAQIDVIPPKFPAEAIMMQGKKIETIDDYLSFKVQYPQSAVDNSIQGTEIVHFLVTPKGEITSMSIINSVCPEIDNAVVQALKVTSGKWKPAYVNGEPAAMEKEVSLVFKLQETEDFISLARNYSKQGNKKLFVMKNPKKAMKYYEKGVNLLPNEDFLLTMRGICKFELGDKEGARSDWSRIKNLTDNSTDHLVAQYMTADISKFKGFSEMKQITEK